MIEEIIIGIGFIVVALDMKFNFVPASWDKLKKSDMIPHSKPDKISIFVTSVAILIAFVLGTFYGAHLIE